VSAARIGLAVLLNGRGRTGRLWCAWHRGPYRRAPDLAGACGLNDDAEALARAALGDAGPSALRRDPLAFGVLRALHRAGELPKPGRSEPWALARPPAPLPTTHTALWTRDGEAVWCVWYAEAEGRPDAMGYEPAPRGLTWALIELRARALDPVRRLPPIRAQAWHEDAVALWRASGAPSSGDRARALATR